MTVRSLSQAPVRHRRRATGAWPRRVTPPPPVDQLVQACIGRRDADPLHLVALGDSGMAGGGVDDADDALPVLLEDTARLLDGAAGLGAPVVVSSLPEFRAMTAVSRTLRHAVQVRGRAAREVQQRVAAKSPAVSLVDVCDAARARSLTAPSTMTADQFHPFAEGYGLIADALAPAVAAGVSGAAPCAPPPGAPRRSACGGRDVEDDTRSLP